MTRINIPPAALEAGARAIRTFYSDEPLAVCDGVAYKAARAAFEAMVANWPEAKRAKGYFTHDTDYYEPALILPMPTENPDAEAR